MRFSGSTLTAALAIAAAPLAASAFAPASWTGTKSVGVTSKNTSPAVSHGNGCLCPACVVRRHPATCTCPSCISGVLLRMSDEAAAAAAAAVAEETPTEDVPPEVEALDGIASEEEAHNAERPARGSGIHKHKKEQQGGGGKPTGTPITELEVGATIEGKVKTITSYGAFVDIGAETDALLHVSRLSDDFVSNVEDVVKAGDTITARIATIDTEKKQVALTMRSEEAEARAARPRGEARGDRRKQRPVRSGGDREAQREALTNLAESGFDGDQFVEGEVVSTLDFGAFVRVDASQLNEDVTGELDGLVHISALTPGRADSVESVVKVGDKVQVRVRGLDPEGGKVSLSMISKEDEAQSRGGGGGGGGGRGDDQQSSSQRRKLQMFAGGDMGPKDWKEQLDKKVAEMPVFKNGPIIVDKR